MKDIGIVHGAAEQAVPLVIGKDLVYIHSNIQEETVTDPVTGQTRTDYSYHEIQYGKDEYIRLMAEQSAQNSELVNTILGVVE